MQPGRIFNLCLAVLTKLLVLNANTASAFAPDGGDGAMAKSRDEVTACRI
jgi:hypothetical protein